MKVRYLVLLFLLTACGVSAPEAASPTTEATAAPNLQATIEVMAATMQAVANAPAAASQATVPAAPTSAPTNAPTALPTDIPTPTPNPILYEADWSGGTTDWSFPPGWTLARGMLISDGSADVERVIAPYVPTVDNYAIEADIEVIPETCGLGSFGILARGAYKGGFYSCGILNISLVEPGTDRFGEQHIEQQDMQVRERMTYRLEVLANSITLYLNGGKVLEAKDNRYLKGGEIGIWSHNTQLVVHSFKVIAL